MRLTILALLSIIAAPAMADTACTLIDHGGYLAYERGCTAVDGKTGAGSAYLDTDDDGVTDTYTADKNG